MKVSYNFSVDCRRKHFRDTGEELPDHITQDVDAALLTGEERWWLGVGGDVWLPGVGDRVPHSGHLHSSAYTSGIVHADGAEAVKTAYAEWLPKREQAIAEAREKLARAVERQDACYDSYLSLAGDCPEADAYRDFLNEREREKEALFQRRRAQEAAYERERRAEAEERLAREAAEKAAALAEREAWIATHGSEYLKTALAEGYNIQRSYIEERIAVEHPNYKCDFAQTMEWDRKLNPAPEHLKAAVEEKAVVAWVTTPPNHKDDDDEYYSEDPSVLLVIENYLGRYTLYRAP